MYAKIRHSLGFIVKYDGVFLLVLGPLLFTAYIFLAVYFIGL